MSWSVSSFFCAVTMISSICAIAGMAVRQNVAIVASQNVF
jgi:hypothetical protein